jgi:hypothetical protein
MARINKITKPLPTGESNWLSVRPCPTGGPGGGSGPSARQTLNEAASKKTVRSRYLKCFFILIGVCLTSYSARTLLISLKFYRFAQERLKNSTSLYWQRYIIFIKARIIYIFFNNEPPRCSAARYQNGKIFIQSSQATGN